MYNKKIKGVINVDKKIKEMRRESKVMAPKIQVGKNGLTEQIIKNIKDEISRHGIVKIKILKAYIESHDKKEAFKDIADRTNAKIVHTLGFTITLARK